MRERGGYSSNKRVEDLKPPPKGHPMSAGDRDTLTDEERAMMNCDCASKYHRDTCFVPVVKSIVAARVRAAQAQAWDECCDFHYRDGNPLPNYGPGPCDENPYRQSDD